MTAPSGKSAETAPRSRRTASFLAVLAGIAAVLGTSQLVSQRLADDLLWAQPRPLRIELSSSPCQGVGSLLRSQQPLPPSAGELLRACFGGVPSNVSAHAQVRALKLLVPRDISAALQPAETYPEEQIAIALYPRLAESVRSRCGRLQRTSPDLCRPERQLMVRDAVGDLLVEMIRSDDDISLLRGLSFACRMESAAAGLADRVGESPRSGLAVQYLRDCALPREDAVKELVGRLSPDDPLLGVAALELRRLGATEATQQLSTVQSSLGPGLPKVLVGYALQGLADIR